MVKRGMKKGGETNAGQRRKRAQEKKPTTKQEKRWSRIRKLLNRRWIICFLDHL